MDDLGSFKETFNKTVETVPITSSNELTKDEINSEIKEHKIEKTSGRLSDKYKGSLTKEQGQALNEHLKQMRGEW